MIATPARRRAVSAPRRAAQIAAITAIAGPTLLLSACTGIGGVQTVAPPAPVEEPVQCEVSVFQRASEQQSSYFESEAQRLKMDLKQAEAAMIAIESGMRSRQSRADAVSALAEARISIESASRDVPWRSGEAADARAKLEEAEKQLQSDHLGTAIFFASRARRIADNLNDEAQRVTANGHAMFVSARRVNLRSGPSTQHGILGLLPRQTPVFPERLKGQWWLIRTLAGRVGWVHATLLQ